ncbi:MAG: SDR family oxidoreductase [Rhodopseudomonas palustris]|nr:SDR family oxidoreductase [Rhodopseudomonas palustris]
MAWGCAKAFRGLGPTSRLLIKTKSEALRGASGARTRRATVAAAGCPQEDSSKRYSNTIRGAWGHLDFVLHSIAFSPKEALQGRVVDVEKQGFLVTMDVSCWSFIRTAYLAEPLMKNGRTLFTMSYYGAQAVVENYNIMGVAKAALEAAVRYIAAELGPKGIRSMRFRPGPLSTPALRRAFPNLTKPLEKRAPRRRSQPCHD